MQCTNCGTENENGVKFCTKCGTEQNPTFVPVGATPYQAPPTPAPPSSDGKGAAVASLIFGVLALGFAWWGLVAVVGLVLAIVGIIFAVVARKANNPSTSGLATGGLVCSIIALAISSIFFVACGLCTACAGGVGSALTSGLW